MSEARRQVLSCPTLEPVSIVAQRGADSLRLPPASPVLFHCQRESERMKALPNGRALPRLYIPEGGTSLEEVEHSMVELAMSQASNNQTNAAKLLDISRDALRYKLKKFNMIRPDDES